MAESTPGSRATLIPRATTKWRTLALATVGFNLSFLIWFSFAPFTGPIAAEFGLSTGQIGILASAAVWGVIPGRMVVGWLADRFGAPTVFSILLVGVGLASVASAFATTYATFFAARLVVAFAGVSFVAGVQHVAQWFPDDQVGTAQGVYAGLGNAGAAGGALLLPRAFGNWTGPVFDAGWRAAFVTVGIAAVGMGAAYWVLGEAAASEADAAAASESATLRGWLYTASRYGVLALAFAYVVSFGLEISLNGWLPTYFREAFGADLVLAGTVAALFSLGAGLLRPIGGHLSDRVARARVSLLPFVEGHHRQQYTAVCLAGIFAGLVGLTLAGRTGSLPAVAGAVFLLGGTCAFTEGAIFAQVPAMFPDRAGAVAGVVGGVGTVGGLGFPLVYAGMAGIDLVHESYLVVAAVLVPVIALHALLCRSGAVDRVRTDGPVDFPADD